MSRNKNVTFIPSFRFTLEGILLSDSWWRSLGLRGGQCSAHRMRSHFGALTPAEVAKAVGQKLKSDPAWLKLPLSQCAHRTTRFVMQGLSQEAEGSVSQGTRTKRSWFVALLLPLIAFSVLAWGTAYKTSLYRPPIAGRAPAKLCTRASDESKAGAERAVAEAALHPIESAALVALYIALYPPASSVQRRSANDADHKPVYLRELPTLFRRPPPLPSWRSL